MDADLGALLNRAETAIDESRRILSGATPRLMAAQFWGLESQRAIQTARRAQIKAVLLQKRADRLLRQAGGVLRDQR